MQISELFAVRGFGVVVTGGASGLGLAYAEALAENGARVTILDLNAAQVAEQSARLSAAGLEVRGAPVVLALIGAPRKSGIFLCEWHKNLQADPKNDCRTSDCASECRSPPLPSTRP